MSSLFPSNSDSNSGMCGKGSRFTETKFSELSLLNNIGNHETKQIVFGSSVGHILWAKTTYNRHKIKSKPDKNLNINLLNILGMSPLIASGMSFTGPTLSEEPITIKRSTLSLSCVIDRWKCLKYLNLYIHSLKHRPGGGV